MPALASDKIAATAEEGTIRGVSKPSGAGSCASRVTNAIEIARPMAATECGQERALDEELSQNVAVSRTQRFAKADLLGSLGDRDQHDVDDPDSAEGQRHDADHAQEPVHRVKNSSHANRFLNRVPVLEGILGLRVKAMTAANDPVHLAFGHKVLFLGQRTVVDE